MASFEEELPPFFMSYLLVTFHATVLFIMITADNDYNLEWTSSDLSNICLGFLETLKVGHVWAGG